MMRVLVTRPLVDAEETAKKLVALGHIPIVAPLMEIRFRDGPQISLDGVQAVLATSSNGVTAFARRTMRRDVPLFAVGAQTAQAARDDGFEIVKCADGDARALAAATLNWARPEGGALLHAAGAETRGDLSAALKSSGYDVRTLVLYEAVAVAALPGVCRSALEKGEMDAALFFSPRSAEIFAARVIEAHLAESCRSATACCISEAAAAAVNSLPWREIRIAPRPDQNALLGLLG